MISSPISASGASVRDRMAAGRELRRRVPRRSHGDWSPAPDRSDPIHLLEIQSADRIHELVPIRYGRMSDSPLAFYRGAALIMADDLARTPRSNIVVQACGDAHLGNFGIFATPERDVVFDVNDFDETLPGPWEWDVKRLATSFVLAGRHRGFAPEATLAAAKAAVRSYEVKMHEFAQMSFLDTWYARTDVDSILSWLPGRARKRTERDIERARLHDSLHAQAKLTGVVDGERRFIDQGPLLRRLRPGELEAETAGTALADYGTTLSHDRRILLSRYRLVDVAVKVVGVGSVGTRSAIVLMHGRDDADALILQVKEAKSSVLERFLRKSRYRHPGQRVVEGQRLMQAASDTFLGWIDSRGHDKRHYYWRQLWDMKGSVDLETVRPGPLALYAEVCGAALARAHARSGDPAMIAGYIGTTGAFMESIASFSQRYADQTERDHGALVNAIDSGRIQAVADV